MDIAYMDSQTCNFIINVTNKMAPALNSNQLIQLQTVLLECMSTNKLDIKNNYSNDEYLEMFRQAKTVEGLSNITITKYISSVKILIKHTDNYRLTDISTDVIRSTITSLQTNNNWSNTTVDTFRRQLSSFFEWMREEEYIIRNPVKKIHKIKCDKKVKAVFSDEDIEMLRAHCENKRELALIDLFASSGMRVSEIASLNITDVDMNQKECITLGKGGKERIVYFDARTKVSLQEYINSRSDDNEALFVSLHKPYNRISVRTIERIIFTIGARTNVGRCFPHKFRASMATKSLDKGMPVEHLQQILGHASMDTTLNYYAQVKNENVKYSHRKYIG